MKKLFTLCLLALALFSCARELREDAPAVGRGKSLVFEGTLATESKIAFGDPENGAYQLVWTKGDAIGIFSLDGSETANRNIRGDLYESSENAAKGIFIPVDRIIEVPSDIEGGDPVQIVEKLEYPENSDEKFLVYYPYGKYDTLEIKGGDKIIRSKIAKVQKQKESGDKKVGANGFCAAFAQVQAGSGKATFNLEHKMAYVRFKAKSTEFAGFRLHSVQIYDKAGEACLSGAFAYNASQDTLEIDSTKGFSSAKVAIEKHDWSEAPEDPELLLTVFPGDYSAADIYVIVTFINEDGATQTIPMQLKKKLVLPASSLTLIDFGDIGTKDNSCPWFETYEVRGLVDMYAYGSENTYMAEHHIRHDPDSRPKSQVTIDVKPRGDFSKVKEPKYFALLVPSEMGCTSIKSNARKLLAMGSDGTGLKRETVPTHTVSSDYTIDVWVLDTTAGTGTWGVVGLYDEDYNLIWSYLICTWFEGHPVQNVTYPNGITVMDRWLGQEAGNSWYDTLGTFVPNWASDTTRKNSGVLPFFQWGRKDPFPWSNSDGNEGIYRSVLADDSITIESGIKNPTTHYGYSSSAASYDTHGDWHNEGVRHDLWGGVNNTEHEWYDPDGTGHKTVFDPCPAGYRIPDSKLFKYVGDNAEIWEAVNGHALQITDSDNPECYLKLDSPFYDKSFSVLAVKDITGKYDYWYFAGYSGNGSNFNGRSSNSKNNALETWSNAVSKADNQAFGRACVLEYGYWSTQRLFNERHSAQRAYRYPVRCQKID